MHTPDNPYRMALVHLERHGGIHTLPETLTLSHVERFCGCSRSWLITLFYNDALPGSRFGESPLWWRCHRQTFIEWLEEHADEYRYTLAGIKRNHPPHPAPAHAYHPRRGRTPL